MFAVLLAMTRLLANLNLGCMGWFMIEVRTVSCDHREANEQGSDCRPTSAPSCPKGRSGQRPGQNFSASNAIVDKEDICMTDVFSNWLM